MPNVKITNMDVATESKGSDDVPIVQDGVNKRITKTLLFTCADGEPFTVKAGNGPSAPLTLQTFDANARIILDDGDDSVKVFTLGGIQLESDDYVTIRCVNGQSVEVKYWASAPGDWGPFPTHLAEAIDRLAAVVAVLIGTPIP